MNSDSLRWKHRAAAAFAPLRSIDRSWLPESLRQHTKLLNVAMLGATTRRLLYSYLPTTSPDDVGAITVPDWAQGGYEQQQRTVTRLGAFACAPSLRRTIEQTQRDVLRRVVDDETYRDIVTQTVALVATDLTDAYDEAMNLGDADCFIAAMGISVLEQYAPQDAAFIRHRIRFQFSRKVWAMRRADLDCDRDRVAEILNQDGNV